MRYALPAVVLIVGLLGWLFVLGGYDSLRYGSSFIAERKKVWTAAVSAALPQGSTHGQIDQWAKANSFAVYDSPDGRTVEILVQEIPYHQIVCTEWKIIALITLEAEKSTGIQVISMGACL